MRQLGPRRARGGGGRARRRRGARRARLDAELLLAEATGWDRARSSRRSPRRGCRSGHRARSARWSAAGCGASRSPTSSAARDSGGSSCAVDRAGADPEAGDRAAGRGGARARSRGRCSTSAPGRARSPWRSPTSCPSARGDRDRHLLRRALGVAQSEHRAPRAGRAGGRRAARAEFPGRRRCRAGAPSTWWSPTFPTSARPSGTGSRRRSASTSRARRWSPGPTGLEAIEALLGGARGRWRSGRPRSRSRSATGRPTRSPELVRAAGFEEVEIAPRPRPASTGRPRPR